MDEGLRNVAELLRRTAALRGDDVAFVDAPTGTSTTWAQLDSVVDHLAAGLRRHGLVEGDRVALLLGNRIEFVATYFAVLRAGLVAVPISTAYTQYEVADLLERSGTRLVVADESSEAVARAAAPGEVVVVGDPSYDALVRLGTRADAQAELVPEQATDPEATAVLLFTSGSSGPSKGAMLSHRALLANVAQLQSLEVPALTGDDVVLLVLPMFHVYALNAVLAVAVAEGARCVLVPRFSADDALAAIATYGVTNVPAAPPVFVAWAARPDLGEALAGVRTLVSGAAPLAPAVFAEFAARAGQPLWEGYGLTEAAPVVSSTMVGRRAKPGCVGSPLPGVEVRLIDEVGEDVDPEDPGEIVVRGANLFSGYWPDGVDGPDADGWYATGDVAFRDDDGDLHIVDRRRDLVLVNGFNVYPYEVETVIASHPAVAEVAVVGVPDERTGEAVVAHVVPIAGSGLTAGDVLEVCRRRLARFKCPSTVEIVASLPHTATGKIAKARLREGRA